MPSVGQTAAAFHGSISSGSVVQDASRKETKRKRIIFVSIFILNPLLNLASSMKKVNCCKIINPLQLKLFAVVDRKLAFS